MYTYAWFKLKERRKIDEIMQMRSFLFIGLFNFICSVRKSTKPTKTKFGWLSFSTKLQLNQSKTEPNFWNGFGSAGLVGWPNHA